MTGRVWFCDLGSNSPRSIAEPALRFSGLKPCHAVPANSREGGVLLFSWNWTPFRASHELFNKLFRFPFVAAEDFAQTPIFIDDGGTEIVVEGSTFESEREADLFGNGIDFDHCASDPMPFCRVRIIIGRVVFQSLGSVEFRIERDA